MLVKYIKNENFWKYGGFIDLEIVIKVSERCNLACDYCYFFFGGDDSYKDNPAIIPARVMDSFVEFIRQAENTLPLRSVRIIFHGGEPLMMPIKKYEQFCSKINSSIKKCKIFFGIQTNATLINEDWIELFSKYEFSVGVSIDGPIDINDAHRIDHNGKGSYLKAVSGLNLLQSAYEKGQLGRPGLIYVINPDVDIERVYNHLTKDLNCKSCHFLLPDFHHGTFNHSKKESFKNILVKLFGLWAADESGVRLRFFSDKMDLFKTSVAEKDVVSPAVKIRHKVISISSSGEIGPNDALRSANPNFMKTGLSVLRNSLLDVLMSDKMHDIWLREIGYPKECSDCDWVRVCRGGHEIINTYSPDSGFFDKKSVYCDSYKEVFEEMALSMLSAGLDESIINRSLWSHYDD